ATGDQPLWCQAGTLQNCTLWKQVEQHLLHLIRHAGVMDVDVKGWSEAGANAGAQFTGAGVGPGVDGVEIEADILPTIERRALAPGQDWDRFVTERKIAHASRCDGGLQLLMREWRRGRKGIIVLQRHLSNSLKGGPPDASTFRQPSYRYSGISSFKSSLSAGLGTIGSTLSPSTVLPAYCVFTHLILILWPGQSSLSPKASSSTSVLVLFNTIG